MKKIQRSKMVLSLAVPLAVGGLSAFLTRDGMKIFRTLVHPPLTPPDWVFPVVWTVLFILMGVGSCLVGTSGAPRQAVRKALTLYGVQLAMNFCWTIVFFNLGWHLFAFVWLILLWMVITATLSAFYNISHPAGLMLAPYLAWVTFAGYLNCGVWLLNR